MRPAPLYTVYGGGTGPATSTTTTTTTAQGPWEAPPVATTAAPAASGWVREALVSECPQTQGLARVQRREGKKRDRNIPRKVASKIGQPSLSLTLFFFELFSVWGDV